MSAIRDVRLLVARHLDQPASVKSAVLRVLMTLDLCLDANGFENPEEVEIALASLERAIISSDLDSLEDEMDLPPAHGDALASDDLVDLDDLYEEPDDDADL